jgi:hypothetical protein
MSVKDLSESMAPVKKYHRDNQDYRLKYGFNKQVKLKQSRCGKKN